MFTIQSSQGLICSELCFARCGLSPVDALPEAVIMAHHHLRLMYPLDADEQHQQ